MSRPFFSKIGEHRNIVWLLGQPGVILTQDDRLVLECSTAGDKQFSPFHASVEVYGITNTIEYWYQTAKGFYILDSDGDVKINLDGRPQIQRYTEDFMKAKSLKPNVLYLRGLHLPTELLEQWYKLLWIKYLDNNTDLVQYLQNFDDYSDCFAHGSLINQANAIRQYMKEGREAMLEECKVLYNILEQQNRIDAQYELEQEVKDKYMDSHI